MEYWPPAVTAPTVMPVPHGQSSSSTIPAASAADGNEAISLDAAAFATKAQSLSVRLPEEPGAITLSRQMMPDDGLMTAAAVIFRAAEEPP